MSAAILTHGKFTNEAAAPVIAPAVTAPAERVDLPPPVRRRTPLVERYREEIADFMRQLIPVVFGLALFIAVWAIVSQSSTLPGPVKTWHSAVQVFGDPFYRKGPNDQGIGWNILNSLG
ncbi:MAG TPA: nitrate ABC transporter, permease protein, partial [Burkholderiales bacterium]|nr:nitrate ABC transporter, permease protein [Burkholderiales bacterium]